MSTVMDRVEATLETRQFLDTLFPDLGGLWLLLWRLPSKESFWTQEVNDEVIQHIHEWATKLDVYVGCGLAPYNPGPHLRCKAEDISGITGLWLDVDYGPGHKKVNLPSTQEEALGLINSMGLEPTIVIHSGHGLQAWWAFKEPWIFDAEEERNKASTLTAAWSRALMAKAKAKGWTADNVGDLSRVMRIPGTWNRKEIPVQTKVLTLADYRWDPLDFEPLLEAHADWLTRTGDRDWSFNLSPQAEPPAEKFALLMENDPKFPGTWTHARKMDSQSEYDLLLATQSMKAGWSGQEIVNLLVANRRKHREDLKLREDYYLRTLNKAAQGSGVDERGKDDTDQITQIGPNSRSDLPLQGTPAWPDPPEDAAFYGMAGEFVRLVEPISEADRVALLIQFLAAFGSVIGRHAYFVAEQTSHHTNLFVVIIGRTSKARKGSSWSHVFRVFQACDLDWASDRVKSGLSSGEGLIWQVRDAIYKKEPEKDDKARRTGGYVDVCVDPGVADKRLLAQEPEFSTVLRMTDREGNTLSAIIRKAWETGNLEALTKNSPAKATGAHISLVGHIVKDEIRRYLSRTEAGNGFANRFIWVCAKRSKVICDDIPPNAVNWDPLIARLRSVIESARGTEQLRRDEGAQEIWRKVYPTLSEGASGLFGAVTSRGEAQVMRLACLYALLDGSSVIKAAHLRAALAFWDYSEASARFIFGDALGDPIADDILNALRMNPSGLTRTQISDLFGRNRNRDQIGRALATLLEYGRVQVTVEGTGVRRAERWYAK